MLIKLYIQYRLYPLVEDASTSSFPLWTQTVKTDNFIMEFFPDTNYMDMPHNSDSLNKGGSK